MRQPNEPDWDKFHDLEIVDWERVRASIQHEDTLTSYRFMWFLTSQSFLFTAFGVLLQAWISKDITEHKEFQYLILVILIFLIGISMHVCFYLWLHLRATQAQLEILRNWWERKYGDYSSSILQVSSKVSKRHPTIGGDKFGGKLITWLIKHNPPHRLPLAFAFCWFVFLICVILSALYRYIPPP